IKTAAKWHTILAHPSVRAIEELPNTTEGIDVDNSDQMSTVSCETYLLSKVKAIISRRSEKYGEAHMEKESQKMAVVSWDITDMTKAIEGSKLFSHFYYDAEAFHAVYPTKTKTQAAELFKAHFTKMISLYDAKTIFLRSDGEATVGEAVTKIVSSFGIVRLSSCSDIPAQNGAGELSGKVIIQAARCLRIEAQLPKNLWPWICGSAAYLLNRTPTKKLSFRTLFEKVTRKLPYLGHLHRIGSKAFALDKKIPRRDKLEARAHIGYLVGFEGTNIYQIWIPHLKDRQKKVIRTRDVIFKDELYKPLEDISLGQVIGEKQHSLEIQRLEIPNAELINDHQYPFIASSIPLWKHQNYGVDSSNFSRESTYEPENRGSDAIENVFETVDKNSQSDTYLKAFIATLEIRSGKKEIAQDVPRIHGKRLPSPPNEFKELDIHEFEKTFEIISSYDGYRIPLKWIWTYKFDENGFLRKFKARLCVREDLQLPSASETYAVTLAMKTFRAVMAITCVFGLETRQYDLVNAFCNAELSKPVYCTLPPVFEQLHVAIKLRRALSQKNAVVGKIAAVQDTHVVATQLEQSPTLEMNIDAESESEFEIDDFTSLPSAPLFQKDYLPLQNSNLMKKARGLLNLLGPYLEEMEIVCPLAGAGFLVLISESVSRAIRGEEIFPKTSKCTETNMPSSSKYKKSSWAAKTANQHNTAAINLSQRLPRRPVPPQKQATKIDESWFVLIPSIKPAELNLYY
ncbi:hypothetical protein EPUL_004607, partial [Erysiphe pulchra]